MQVLAGKMKPNLGRFDNPPDWSEILNYFRGSELQTFFTRILEDTIKVFFLLYCFVFYSGRHHQGLLFALLFRFLPASAYRTDRDALFCSRLLEDTLNDFP